MLAVAAMLFGTAWIGDDAFITLRVIDNFINGWGLRYNVIERVQVFTHPLWLLFLTPLYAVTHEALVTTIVASVLLSLGAFYILATRIAEHLAWGCFLALLAVASRAICQYSTSGLENPLTFLLLALFVWCLYHPPKRAWVPAGIAGLLLLNRLDLAVLLGPVVIYLLFQAHGIKRVKIVLVTSFPALMWIGFSLLYYGMPFPNTAYAKLGTGVNTGALVMQGLEYTKDFVLTDPLLALIIGKVVFDTLHSRHWPTVLLGTGIVLYTAYIIAIGGDFMSGRFFAAPGFLALCLLARTPAPQWWISKWKVASLITICLLGVLLVVRITERPITSVPDNGINDLRRFCYADNGLFPVLKAWVTTGIKPIHTWGRSGQLLKAQYQTTGKPVAAKSGAVGMVGYYGGPGVYIMDVNALTDAFLARLPVSPGWRVGHYQRDFPPAYFETALEAAPTTNIEDLRPLLSDVILATRAPLLAEGRGDAIWRLLIGRYNWIHDAYMPSLAIFNKVITQLSQGLYKDAGETASNIADPEARDILTKLVLVDHAVHVDSVSSGKSQEAINLLWNLGNILKQPPTAGVSKWNPILHNIILSSKITISAEWETLARHFPDDESVRYNAGLWLLSEHQYDAAEIHLRAATESQRLRESVRGTAFKNLGIALINTRRFAKAEIALRAALSQSPPDMDAYCWLSVMYKWVGQLEDEARTKASCPTVR